MPCLQRMFVKARLAAQLGNLEQLGGVDFVAEMIHLFLQTAQQNLATARRALAEGDRNQLRRAVHSLKSSAANMGADALSTLAFRIERLASDERGEELPALLAELERALRCTAAQLRDWRGSGRSD